jgi:phosphoadenosine phosphosulfate reductase
LFRQIARIGKSKLAKGKRSQRERKRLVSTVEINTQVNARLDAVRATLAREITGAGDVCLTCSFQAEDVLLTKLALELDAKIPVLFLDTGYHFAETYAYRDRIAHEWNLNLINLLPEKTVAEQEAEHGLLYQSAPDQCCKLRKVEPLFKAVAGYRVWLTGLRREQARSRTALEESALFMLPGGKQVLKLAPLAAWTTRDVWYACEQLSIPLLSLYELGYSSIGCEPCTSLPLDPNDPRSGRWAGRKVECGIHIEAAVK